MDDELLLNFGAKFQRLIIISNVKLQSCHDVNVLSRVSAKMAGKF